MKMKYCSLSQQWEGQIKNYLKGKLKWEEVSEENISHIRICYNCLKQFASLEAQLKLKYKNKQVFFKRCSALELRLKYNDGIIYEQIDELLWDEKTTGRPFKTFKKEMNRIQKYVINRLIEEEEKNK